MDSFFAKFPFVSYNDVLVSDITRRVSFDTTTSKLPTFFYPYEVRAGVRSDMLAYDYYQDPTTDWLIYLTNGIIDPYYGWHLTFDDFNQFIKKKYGSIQTAQTKIKEFSLNSFNAETNITVSFYNNNVPDVLKKYWYPIFGAGSSIIAYAKKSETWTVNTNRILQIFNIKSSLFTLGERIQLLDVNNVILGVAEIIKINSDSIIVNNVLRVEGIATHIVGETSKINSNITSMTTLTINISDNEFSYWTPIYYYDYEYEKNEANKFVKLLDARFASDASEAVRQKLQEK